jgi:hypothetical protein
MHSRTPVTTFVIATFIFSADTDYSMRRALIATILVVAVIVVVTVVLIVRHQPREQSVSVVPTKNVAPHPASIERTYIIWFQPEPTRTEINTYSNAKLELHTTQQVVRLRSDGLGISTAVVPDQATVISLKDVKSGLYNLTCYEGCPSGNNTITLRIAQSPTSSAASTTV